jgi:L-serine dehydratase
MERISVFEIFKIGIGPSSSHTLGPWIAVKFCLTEYCESHSIKDIYRIKIELYGSLAKTGSGHGTDIAVQMGLLNEDPEKIDREKVFSEIAKISKTRKIPLFQKHTIVFDPLADIVFIKDHQLPFHPNGLKVLIEDTQQNLYTDTWYSIGGGFVVRGDEELVKRPVQLPFPIDSAHELLMHCQANGLSISEVVMENEKKWRSEKNVVKDLNRIWDVMKQSVFSGCNSTGVLPGGLNVKRRASFQNEKLIKSRKYEGIDEWLGLLKQTNHSFRETLNWVSCFALAVNEENASFGRVVTAPTNGAAGVIPAVLFYYVYLCDDAVDPDPVKFLLIAGELGSIFKKGATISAAMGGCQAEIGVSSAMAAAALTECLGGSPEESLMAAEIAMEHHLGLTCDPIGGLVQVPCIERNAMGAMKAITAAQIALASDPHYAKVSLDDVIKTMWNTARDMNSKYKETSEGGLAVNIPVNFPDC